MQSSLTGLRRNDLIFPSDESLGYFHLVRVADERIARRVRTHMKRNTKTLVALICFTCLFSLSLSAQERVEGILVDEHGEVPCDLTLEIIDIFFSELSNHPLDSGVVVISSRAEKKHRALFQQMIIEHQTKWRGFDPTRIKFLRTKSEDTKIQFWRIPPGARDPEVKDVDMSYAIPEDIKPFLMGCETKMGDQICPEVDDGDLFARFLKANRNARGNLVVRDTSLTRARLKAGRVLRRFSSKYGIPHSRLRVFAAPFERRSSEDEPIVEYWYLP